jgi:sterol desaturase/sphingolipid hydroxylase (fatty acid hydroxylase superfamily)
MTCTFTSSTVPCTRSSCAKFSHHPRPCESRVTSFRYRIFHKVHHLSVDPTPFASFAFHPFEAGAYSSSAIFSWLGTHAFTSVLEAGIAYICIFTLPIHPYALLAFQTASFLINVYGHLGYEFSQSRTTVYAVWNPLRYINRTCHHHDHHKRCVQSRAHSLLLAPRCITLLRSGGGCKSGNFGLYTTVWDHLFSTMLTAPPLKPRD